MIPKIIHYCWFGGKPIPNNVKTCIKSWKKYCPEYEIKEWNENNFDISCHPFIESAFKARAWAFVSDYARLKIVYETGGIYLDTDVELIKSLDGLLENKCYIGVQQGRNYVNTGQGFGAEKSHPMIKAMLEMYDGLTYKPELKNQIMCPILNTKALEKYGYTYKGGIEYVHGACVYPQQYFDPYSSGDSQNLMCEDTISIHHYDASWTGGIQSLKRKFARLLGVERVLLLKRLLGMNQS